MMTLIIFFARRLIIPLALIIFYDSKWAQWLSYFLTSIVVFAWTYAFRPYKEKENQFVEEFCEMTLMIVILFLPTFEYITDSR